MVPLLMTLKYIWRSFQPRLSFPRPFQQPVACFRVARSPSNSWASCVINLLSHTVVQKGQFNWFRVAIFFHLILGLTERHWNMFPTSLAELNLAYETYHTRLLFFERNARTLRYSILAYAYPRALPCMVSYRHSFCRNAEIQESCAIAKITAQCALHMGALKIFGTPWLRPRPLFPTFSWPTLPFLQNF